MHGKPNEWEHRGRVMASSPAHCFLLKVLGGFDVEPSSWGFSGPDDGDNTGGRGERVENGGAASQVSWIFSQALSCLGTKLMLSIFILGLGLVLRYSVVQA